MVTPRPGVLEGQGVTDAVAGHRHDVPATDALGRHLHQWYPLTEGRVIDLDALPLGQAVAAAVAGCCGCGAASRSNSARAPISARSGVRWTSSARAGTGSPSRRRAGPLADAGHPPPRVNARVPGLDAAAFRQLTTPRMALLTPGHLHPATTANTPGLQPGRLALGSRRTTCPARSSRPAHFAGSALQTGSFSTCTSARITFSETTTLNRTMTIPVTRATGLAKPEALRGRWPMSLSRGAGLTGCRPGGSGSPSSTGLRCPRRGVLMAVKNATASGDLAGELACLTRTLKPHAARWGVAG